MVDRKKSKAEQVYDDLYKLQVAPPKKQKRHIAETVKKDKVSIGGRSKELRVKMSVEV